MPDHRTAPAPGATATDTAVVIAVVSLAGVQVEVNRGGVAGAGEAGFDPDAIGERFRYDCVSFSLVGGPLHGCLLGQYSRFLYPAVLNLDVFVQMDGWNDASLSRYLYDATAVL